MDRLVATDDASLMGADGVERHEAGGGDAVEGEGVRLVDEDELERPAYGGERRVVGGFEPEHRRSRRAGQGIGKQRGRPARGGEGDGGAEDEAFDPAAPGAFGIGE